MIWKSLDKIKESREAVDIMALHRGTGVHLHTLKIYASFAWSDVVPNN